MDMAVGRYKLLFPGAGHKIDQKNYNSWLRRHSREFEDDTFGQSQYDEPRNPRSKAEEFYEVDEYDEDYDDEYDEGYYEDDEDSEYDDYDEAYDDYEDDYDDRIEDKSYNRHKQSRNSGPSPKAEPVGTFNFFAGCNSRESADRKYKQLVKLYHPDNMDGDTSALQEINVQYGEIKKKFRA